MNLRGKDEISGVYIAGEERTENERLHVVQCKVATCIVSCDFGHCVHYVTMTIKN